MLLDVVEKLENAHAKRVCNYLDGIERWIGIPCLNPAQIGLIKTTLLSKHDLAHTGRKTQGAHAGTKLLSQSCFHTSKYLGYALNHIHTNSHNRVAYRMGRRVSDGWLRHALQDDEQSLVAVADLHYFELGENCGSCD